MIVGISYLTRDKEILFITIYSFLIIFTKKMDFLIEKVLTLFESVFNSGSVLRECMA